MSTGRSQSQHQFSQIPKAEIQRSSFNRSHGLKTALFAGDLVPIFVDEALPGDTMNMNASIFARIATLINPIMDNVYLDVFFFAVPNRLLWDNWEKFNGAQTDPGDSTDFLIPTIGSGAIGWGIGSVQDYMGVPPLVPNINCSALPLRAYNLIYNDWFRSEDLQDSVIKNVDDGPDMISDYALLKRGKRHDYFTSCLPWPQKADAVELPLGTTAPVIPDLSNPTVSDTATFTVDGGTAVSKIHQEPGADHLFGLGAASGESGAIEWIQTGMVTDLSSATAATINTIRQAFQIQRLYERDARGGTRYAEILKSHFGISSPDSRLQRPEYLGGGTIPVMIKQVENTTSVGSANLAAYGIAQKSGINWTKSFTEHCTIIGLVCARADLNYQQGMERMWSRQTRWDFYWPALAHLGEQAVLNQEIQAQGSDVPAWDAGVFGYQERYAEYRYKPNMVTGLMRSIAALTLDVWHLAQEFDEPVLNATFIQENPPFDRVLAVPGSANFILDGFFNYKCARPMPTYSVPGMIDHF